MFILERVVGYVNCDQSRPVEMSKEVEDSMTRIECVGVFFLRGI